MLLTWWELDAAPGLADLGQNVLIEWRTVKNKQHSMVALVRQSVFSRLAGCNDTNDAERLLSYSRDAACRCRTSHGAQRGLHQPDGTLRDRGVDAADG
jgi:hypothetical protein